jgi:hypothetical protein
MAAIDVQQVDRLAGEAGCRLVEARLDERRERPVFVIVVSLQGREHRAGVRADVIVAGPGVDGVAPCAGAERLDRLAEGHVRHAVVRAELDEARRAREVHGQHSEWNVPDPRREMNVLRAAGDDGMIVGEVVHSDTMGIKRFYRMVRVELHASRIRWAAPFAAVT